jgi:uncharacterized membrane protein
LKNGIHGKKAMKDPARRTQGLVLIINALLAATVIGWTWAATSSWPARLLLMVVNLLPIALPLRGVLRRDRRTYAWSTFSVLPYLVFAITEAVATPQMRPWSGACVTLAFAWFVALIAALRASRPAIENGADETHTQATLRGE